MRHAHVTIVALLVLAIAAGGAPPERGTEPATARTAHSLTVDAADTSFAAQVDLRAFGTLAVHNEGRVKSFDSFARDVMQFVTGAKLIEGRSSSFTYLDMMLRPERYADADVIFVKNKVMRAQIAQALRESLAQEAQRLSGEAREALDRRAADTEARLDRFVSTGLISSKVLSDRRVNLLLGRLSTDVLRSAKLVQALENALNVMDAATLRNNLRMVAPPGGGAQDRWFSFDELESGRPQVDPLLANMPPDQRERIASRWRSFTAGWIAQNPGTVNDAAAQLAALLPNINVQVYPQHSRLAWESWYFKMRNMTWVWVIYALALVPLLLSVAFRFRAARWIGLGLFLLAFGLHSFTVMLRWYVAQRWPNSNMFEAVTTAAWFGGCLALALEIFLRRSPMRGVFAIASATASMCALMAVHFLPLELNPGINNMMPVLNDVWLYIHTNMIIFSYCLIFMAAMSATLYLIHRGLLVLRGLEGAAGAQEFARVGGAGSLIITRPDGSTYLQEGRSSLGQVLDGTTMVIMELAFITLWTGLCMGAIWADHSWGRPWGWDPKEVFALNTFLVFLVLVHVRLKVKDKGLWTAVLALVGACVMLFNWIIINFAISGLHSYA